VPRNAWITLPLLSATLALPLHAALPELSSIEPLEFDEGAQRLIARGDARLEFDNTRVRADRITYYQEFGLADAIGNVAVSRDGSRLIAERLNYDAEASVFSLETLRAGQWPFLLSGETAGGTAENISVQNSTVYYGNPSTYGLSMSAEKVQYVKGESDYVKMNSAVVRIGKVPVFYLPTYTHYIGASPYYLDVAGGADDQLGTYIQTTTLFPTTSWLRLGANLDYYTKRSVLVGPTAQYVYDSSQQQILGSISTGFIDDDSDDRGLDILEDPIEAERAFAEWRHKHYIGERFTSTARASYWSDSEVTRDFRDSIYNENRQPDNFAEGAYAGDNYFISAFGRFRPNQFQIVQERLPEVRVDVLPTPIFNTGVYQKLSASYVQMREDLTDAIPLITKKNKYNRFDLSYRIERPIRIFDWLTLTPLAGGRLTQYENQQLDDALGGNLVADSYTRELYELGFDLESQLYASYPTVNSTWDVQGLRHILRPVMHYRYFSAPSDSDEIASIERQIFDLERPILDLSDLRNVDSISETHLVRLGVENLYQTRAAGYGSRTLAALNFYQDVLFDKGTRYDGDEEETFNATWVEFVLTPAPWLKFDLDSRFKTTSLTLEELRTRTSILSGEIWELGLSTDLLNERIEQYRIDFIYRFNERYSLLTDLRFDADSGQLTETQLGFRSRVGSTWEVLYAVTFREGAQRESDVEFNVRLRLVQQ